MSEPSRHARSDQMPAVAAPVLGAAAAAPLPADGWIVGSGPTTPATRAGVERRRSARLEARLAVYAQHAALVAEQAEATLAGDAGRLHALAARRSAVAEHFDELQAVSGEPGASASAESGVGFGLLLGEALAELEHLAAVDIALQQRLVGLRDAVLRGAAWAQEAAGGATPGPALLLAGGEASAGERASDARTELACELTSEVANALVSARAGGVGGALGGHFPGRAPADPAAPPSGQVGGQVDVRF